MGKSRFRTWMVGLWQPVLGYSIALLTTLLLLIYRLGSLLPGFSNAEQAAYHNHSFSQMIADPLFLPHRLLQLVIIKVFSPSFGSARLASVIIALGLIVSFYYTLTHWFSKRVAVVSTVLFASSAWFLHIARSAEPTIILLFSVIVIAYGTETRGRRFRHILLPVGTLLAAMMLYIPGMIWFVIAGAVWQRRVLKELIQTSKVHVITGSAILGVLLLPLIYSSIKDPHVLYEIGGLPKEGMNNILQIGRNFLDVPIRLLWHGPNDPSIWLGRMPLLDFGSVLLAILGIYSFLLDWQLDRSRIVIGGAALSWMLTSLGGPVSVAILLPFCFLFVAAGIAFMVGQWFTVFPRNPFARGLAYVLLGCATLAIGWYNVQHYFVAWPRTPATRASYRQIL